MKTNSLLRICTSLALAVPAVASASDSIASAALNPEQIQTDKLIRSTKIINIGGESDPEISHADSAYRLIGRFYADQFRNFQDPRAPYFMFMSKNADLAMGIGGLVRMRGWFDWNGSIPANGFSPYMIQIPKDPTNMRKLDATPAGTGLFLTLLAHKPWLGYLTAYIEGNFDGYNHVGFKLKKAYVTINDLTVGYATSTFCDPAALAPTIDGAGANGKIDRTNVLVRYMHTFKGHWTVGGSFEFPKSSLDAVSYTHLCSQLKIFRPRSGFTGGVLVFSLLSAAFAPAESKGYCPSWMDGAV